MHDICGKQPVLLVIIQSQVYRYVSSRQLCEKRNKLRSTLKYNTIEALRNNKYYVVVHIFPGRGQGLGRVEDVVCRYKRY